jgi:hypothetical protein
LEGLKEDRLANKGMKASRRAVLASGAAAGALMFAGQASRVLAEAGPVQTIKLTPEVAPRALPAHILGYNCPGAVIPYEMPAFVPALKAIGPQFLRFPGGTVGNYYNWHDGQMEVTDVGDSGSAFRKHFARVLMPESRKLHPNGIWVEDWDKIAKDVDASLVIMANLETSTPEGQAAWFADMKTKSVHARYVELGNEFFLGMGDEAGREKFPSPEYTTALTKRFYDAIKPNLPRDAKVAVQSSSAAFGLRSAPKPDAEITLRRIWDWDQALKPEPWFDAVTMHLYPTETGAAGLDTVKKLPATVDTVFDAMLARVDGGYDRGLSDVAARVPGKEIWMTEYGAFDPYEMYLGMEMHYTGLWLHQVTREMLTIMRHPQVTVACFHAAYFYPGILMSDLLKVGDELKPINGAAVHHWFFEASRGPGCTWQRMKIDGAVSVAANGARPGETYWDVDAGIFRRGSENNLFVHNASKTPRRLDLSSIVPLQATLSAETIATPELLAPLDTATSVPQPLATSSGIEVPAYSITRLKWNDA